MRKRRRAILTSKYVVELMNKIIKNETRSLFNQIEKEFHKFTEVENLTILKQ